MPSPTAESILGGTKARDELSKVTPETRKDKKESNKQALCHEGIDEKEESNGPT